MSFTIISLLLCSSVFFFHFVTLARCKICFLIYQNACNNDIRQGKTLKCNLSCEETSPINGYNPINAAEEIKRIGKPYTPINLQFTVIQ